MDNPESLCATILGAKGDLMSAILKRAPPLLGKALWWEWTLSRTAIYEEREHAKILTYGEMHGSQIMQTGKLLHLQGGIN